MSSQKFTCSNCSHHMYNHNYANPKQLTKKERKTGLIPWYCDIQDCDCIEYIPGK